MAEAVLQLPRPREVAQLLADTLGREANATEGRPVDITEAMSGFYMNADGTEGIVCVTDVPLVNYAGAALRMP